MVPERAQNRFYDVVGKGNLAQAKQLLDAHPELANLPRPRPFLHLACAEKQREMAALLIKRGADLEARDSGGYTVLQRAASRDELHPLVRWLVKAGANVNCGTRTTPPPLASLALNNAVDLVQFLVDQGADVNASYDMGGGKRSPLFIAEREGHAEIAQLLRKHGAVPLDQAASAAPRTFRDDVLDHLEKHVGAMDRLALHETIAVSAVSVSVHIIPPAKDRPYRTLATCGVSEEALVPPPKKRGRRHVELLIRLPAEWRVDPEAAKKQMRAMWPVQWLRMCAHRIHDQRLWLGEGIVLPAPRRIPKNWRFAGFLLTESEIPVAKAKGRREVSFYLVRPILPSEMKMAEREGVAALVERWTKAKRSSVHDEKRAALV